MANKKIFFGDNIENGGKKIVINSPDNVFINEQISKPAKSPLLISNGRNKKDTYARKVNLLSMPEVDINWQYNQIILKHFVMRRCRYYNSQIGISLKKIKTEVENPSSFRNIILTGKAGVGKTTVLKWLYVNSYVRKCSYIYLTAKMFAGISSLEEVCEIIDSHLTTDEPCIVFFDGLDELQCINGTSRDIEAFLNFFEQKSGGVSSKSKNRFIISTRPEHFAFHSIFRKRQAKKNLDRYVVFEIMPLNYYEALDVCLSIKFFSEFDREHDFSHFLDKWPYRKNSTSNLYSLSEINYKKQLKQYLSMEAKETNFLLSTPLLCRYAYPIICDWTATENYSTSKIKTLGGQIESALRSYIKWEFHDENNISTTSDEGIKILKEYSDEVFEFLTQVASLMNKNEFIGREQWGKLKLNYTNSLNSTLCVLQENEDGELVFVHRSFKNYFLSRYYIQKKLHKRKNKKVLKTFVELINADLEFCVFYAEQFISVNTTLSNNVCKAIAETSPPEVGKNITEIIVEYLSGNCTLFFKNDFPFTIEQYLHVFPCGKVLYGGETFTLLRLQEIRRTKILETDDPEYFVGCKLSKVTKNLNFSGIMYNSKYTNEFKVMISSFFLFFNGEIIGISGFTNYGKKMIFELIKIIEREGLWDKFRAIQYRNLNATDFLINQILPLVQIEKENGNLAHLMIEHKKIYAVISSIIDFLGHEKNYWCFFDGSSLFVCEISTRNSPLFSNFFFKQLNVKNIDFCYSMLGSYISQTRDENISADSIAFVPVEKLISNSIFDFEVKKIFDPRNLLNCYYNVHFENIRLINQKKSSLDLKSRDYIMELNCIENIYKTVEEILKEKFNEKLWLIISDEMLITYYFSEQNEKLTALASETLELCRVFRHDKGEQLRLLFINSNATFSDTVKSIVEDYAKNNIWYFN